MVQDAQAPTGFDADAEPIAYINGKRHVLPAGRAEVTLLQYLREKGLTGTKLGCGEGGCGACTVMVSHHENGSLHHRAVNACLCPLYAVEGMHVVTVEGIGNVRDGLHPVQERLAKSHGSQCGFCTPGFVMSMYSLLRGAKEAPNEEDIEECLAGNLCRCTGYRPILDAFKTFAKTDPAAYTEEAIAASKGIAPPTSNSTNGSSGSNGSNSSNGSNRSNGTNGSNGSNSSNGTNGALSSSGSDATPPTNGHGTNGHATNGASTTNGASAANGANGVNGAASSTKVCPSSGLPCDCSTPAASATNGAATAGACGLGAACCKANGSGSCCAAPAPTAPARPTAEPIFPPELKARRAAFLYLPGPFSAWYRPTSLQQLLALKAAHPDAKLVGGNTEVGIEMKFKAAKYPHLVAATHVPELTQIEVGQSSIRVGASTTLTTLHHLLKHQITTQPIAATSGFRAASEQLRWFAGLQIRNTATLGGNIVTASPISDLNPLWMAMGAVFTVAGEGTGMRDIKASDFFIAYRKTAMAPHEVLVSVTIPFTRPHEYVLEFKQSPRRDDDIAIVNAGIRIALQPSPASPGSPGGWVVADAAAAFGGVAAKTIMAQEFAKALVGKEWNEGALEAAMAAVRRDVAVGAEAPGGRSEYRNSLAASFVFKSFARVCMALEADVAAAGGVYTAPLPESHRSAAAPYSRPPVRGVQFYAKAAEGEGAVGQDYRHMAADLQVSGQAQYTGDVPLPPNALHAAFVTSARPHARLLSVDASAALALLGVVGYFDHTSVPGDNMIGPVKHDEEVFSSGVVTCVGAVIGVVVGETEAAARRGAAAVVIEYEELPAIISIEQAIAAGSFYSEYEATGTNIIQRGDVDAALASPEAANTISGTLRLGGQEHFYLEPQTCFVVPQEEDEYLIVASTQAPAKHQRYVASVLGVGEHKIVSKSKRLGGGFGGKETRGIFIHTAIAVAAFHTKRPVLAVLDRDEDMQMSGHRHPFLTKYKVAYSSTGRIVAADLHLYCNAGNSWDLSHSIMDRALGHSDCAYNIPAMRVTGHLCKTNISSNTAFRGFGGPQGMMFAEMWMERVATSLNLPPAQVRALNLYHEGDTTHFGQVMENCHVRACWDKAMANADYSARADAVAAFNAKHRYRKRGLAAMPSKFGISFTTLFLNQAGALVHIYTDGTVLVTHGGVEMGQGLHTKIAQVAAHNLGVPISSVFISETSTDKVPNASPTAASASSDMYGGAVLDAVQQLNARLAPYREKAPGATFKELVNAAYLDRTDLSAHGFYATPGITGFGGNRPFNYFVFGAAVAEVELDCLTGDWQLLRADVVMDVGNPINPAIDIGQIEGGFVQGMGWLCLEELIWGDEEHKWVRPGHLFTKGPGTYKIPTANDVPVDFRVELLQNVPNPRAIHSSKAVGEPPFHLGGSVFFALKDAVYAARADAGHTGYFVMDAPATPERLRMLCADDIAAHYAPHNIRPKISC